MNLRTQLEGNSFSEMIQRNTDGTNTLKADVFATADCKFQLGRIIFPYDGSTTSSMPALDPLSGAGSVNDDLLDPGVRREPAAAPQAGRHHPVPRDQQRRPVRHQRAVGLQRDAPASTGSSAATTTTPSGVATAGTVIEGNGGDDVALGGDGDDIVTDLSGADVHKGGPGRRRRSTAASATTSSWVATARTSSTAAPTTTRPFAGPGDDFVIAGQGADAIFGDGGDDWIQGGSGQDLLDRRPQRAVLRRPGRDPAGQRRLRRAGRRERLRRRGRRRHHGAERRGRPQRRRRWLRLGHPPVRHGRRRRRHGDQQQPVGLAAHPVVVNRDRWQETEADSGSPFERRDPRHDEAPERARRRRLHRLRRPGPGRRRPDQGAGGDPAAAHRAGLAPVVAASAAGFCPLSGHVWGEGNILLGGGGSDTLEGRGADDVIDGDRCSPVRISVRTNAADPATEIGSTDLMEQHVPGRQPEDAAAGGVRRDRLDRRSWSRCGRSPRPPASDSGAVDTAVFSGPSGEVRPWSRTAECSP